MSEPAIFLSYNRIDKDIVVVVQRALQERGVITFLDQDKLTAGLPWPQALELALADVQAVAVFIGQELGGWQKREMWFALERQVSEEEKGNAFPVIPVLLPGADLSAGFLFLNTWIDLRAGIEGPGWSQAVSSFEKAIGSVSLSTEQLHSPDSKRNIELCPYRGLDTFREEDAAFFAGRQLFAGYLLDFTLKKELVAIVGPSGSGKSSVVRAALLPLLRKQQPPAKTWDAVIFTPGTDPCHRLASAVIPLLESGLTETAKLAEAQDLSRNLADGRTRLDAVINRIVEKSNGTSRILVVADQFEELFTITPSDQRRKFAEILVRALGKAPFTLLITLRADFYSQIIELNRELSDLLAPAQVNIGGLTPEEFRECITSPAKLVGLDFEPGLVERILSDVGDEPGRLPLVEFALTELWQRRDGNRLLNGAYDQIGGVTGALARRAEAEFSELKLDEKKAAHRLFSRLVRVGKPEDAGEDVRQRTELSDEDGLAKRVATKFADARLLVTGVDADARPLSVEVAHEALIRNWQRLRSWLNEDREFLLWRQRLQAQVHDWEKNKQEIGYLLRGAPLTEAESWLLSRSQDLAANEQALIRESVALRDRELLERQRTRRRLISSLGVLIGLIGVLTGVGFLQHAEAQRSERQLAENFKATEMEAERTDLRGALTVFSTSYGGEALELNHRGLFTSELERFLFKRYVGVSEAMHLAQSEVLSESTFFQSAEVLSSMNGEVFLNPRNQKRKVFALVAGWNLYGVGPWHNLEGAIADAKSIDGALRTVGYSSRLLLDASSAELNHNLDDLLLEATHNCEANEISHRPTNVRGVSPGFLLPPPPCRNVLVFLYFSGHGFSRNGTTFIVTRDSFPSRGASTTPESGVSIEALRGKIAERVAAQIVIADVSRTIIQETKKITNER